VKPAASIAATCSSAYRAEVAPSVAAGDRPVTSSAASTSTSPPMSVETV
jgi:hypothetical protein